jgi:serine/threonine-protein kinase
MEPTSMTSTGAILGSPVYMSPEQAKGVRTTDARSDIYSLGVVMFECLTGRTPFDADTFNELMFKIALEDVPDVRRFRSEVDAPLAKIISKALAREAAQRYATANELARALAEWLESSGASVRDWRRSSANKQPVTEDSVSVTIPAPPDDAEERLSTSAMRVARGGEASSTSGLVAAATVAREAPSGSTKRWGLIAAACAIAVLSVGFVMRPRAVPTTSVPAAAAPPIVSGAPATSGAHESAVPSAAAGDTAIELPAEDPSGEKAAPKPAVKRPPTNAATPPTAARPGAAPTATAAIIPPVATTSKPPSVGGRSIQTEL